MFSALRVLAGVPPTLHDAAHTGNLPALHAALQRGEHPDDTAGVSRDPALLVACRAGGARAVEALLDAGANACARNHLPKDSSTVTSVLGAMAGAAHLLALAPLSTTPLHAAAAASPPSAAAACVAALLARRPQLPVLEDSFVETPVEAALAAGNVDAAALLVGAAGEPGRAGEGDAVNVNFCSGAWLPSACAGCAKAGSLAPLEFLEARGLRAEGLPLAPLIQACAGACPEPLLARLLALGVAPEPAKREHPPALALFAAAGNVACVARLLALGVDPRLRFERADWGREQPRGAKAAAPPAPHAHPLRPWLRDGEVEAQLGAADAALQLASAAGTALAGAATAAASAASGRAPPPPPPPARAPPERRACSLCSEPCERGASLLGAPVMCLLCNHVECAPCVRRHADAIGVARASMVGGSGKCRALLQARADALTAADGGCVHLVPAPQRNVPSVVGTLSGRGEDETAECGAELPQPASGGGVGGGGGGGGSAPLGISLAGIYEFAARCGSNALEGLTLAEVNTLFLKPHTEATRGSYVEQLRASGSAHVGPAGAFVSHAWNYKYLDTTIASIEAWEAADAARAGTFYWLDMFTNSQHDTATKPFEWWRTVFRSSVKSIGRTLLVLPWEDPVALTRVWCVFEIFCSTKLHLEVCMPPASKGSFRAALFDDVLSVAGAMDAAAKPKTFAFAERINKVDLSLCGASNPADQVNIFRAIKLSGGIAAVNGRVCEALAEWAEAETSALLRALSPEEARTLLTRFAGLRAKQLGCGVAEAAQGVGALDAPGLREAVASLAPALQAQAAIDGRMSALFKRVDLGGSMLRLASEMTLTSKMSRSLAAVRRAPPHGPVKPHYAKEKNSEACSLCGEKMFFSVTIGMLLWRCAQDACRWRECNLCHSVRRGAPPPAAPPPPSPVPRRHPHPLAPAAQPAQGLRCCDICHHVPGERIFHCATCEWDECPACFAANSGARAAPP